jgi:NADH-ubiquinone oxidoreductase chain 1
LIVVLLTGSLNLTINVEAQKVVFFFLPLLPIFIIFFIGCIAETNRAPFDLAEAESELVSGFMTEHSAVIFVFFFLAEYASIVLICIFTSLLFLGGYLKIFSFDSIIEILIYFFIINVTEYLSYLSETHINIIDVVLEGLISSLSLGLKSCLMIFVFIWARASFPRIRFDQLMSYC